MPLVLLKGHSPWRLWCLDDVSVFVQHPNISANPCLGERTCYLKNVKVSCKLEALVPKLLFFF